MTKEEQEELKTTMLLMWWEGEQQRRMRGQSQEGVGPELRQQLKGKCTSGAVGQYLLVLLQQTLVSHQMLAENWKTQ